MKTNTIYKELIKSYELKSGFNGSISDILNKIEGLKLESHLETEVISLNNLPEWSFDNDSGNFSHASGKFFKIVGCDFKKTIQPIIVQPEIGILGFLTAMVGGSLHFLTQLKNEPGNIDGVQLSPTVQATKSNYSQVHGGSLPKHLEFFIGDHQNTVIADQYLSEQGSRYFNKRNRNIILFTENPPKQDSTHLWLTLGQIKDLIGLDNTVNSCARSVISMISVLSSSEKTYDQEVVDQNKLSKIMNFKDSLNYKAILTPLNVIRNWSYKNGEYASTSKEDFKLIGCSVNGKNREVTSWTQPLLKESGKGEYGLCIGTNKSQKYILWKIRNEPGLYDFFELGPTWIKRSEVSEENPLSCIYKSIKLVRDVELAEEGGRFYKSSFSHLIINIGDFEFEDLPIDIIPFTIRETQKNMTKPNFFTIEARSLWSLISEKDFD